MHQRHLETIRMIFKGCNISLNSWRATWYRTLGIFFSPQGAVKGGCLKHAFFPCIDITDCNRYDNTVLLLPCSKSGVQLLREPVTHVLKFNSSRSDVPAMTQKYLAGNNDPMFSLG